MFFTLLAVTLAVSLATSFVVVRLFRKPIGIILSRIVSEEMASACQRYVEFAIYVVGVSGGVRIGRLEQYITPGYDRTDPIVLNAERWTLEVYRTLIGTLQGITWMLLSGSMGKTSTQQSSSGLIGITSTKPGSIGIT